MKKQVRIAGFDKYTLEGSAKQVIKNIQKILSEQEVDDFNIDIDAEEYYGSISIEVTGIYEREETKDERQQREAQEKARAEFLEKRQRLEYEALKAKFEGTS